MFELVIAMGILVVLAILVVAFVSDDQPEDWDDVA